MQHNVEKRARDFLPETLISYFPIEDNVILIPLYNHLYCYIRHCSIIGRWTCVYEVEKTDQIYIYVILPNSERHRELGPKLTDFIRCGLLAHFHADGDFISVHEKYIDDEDVATNFSDFAET